uniref:Uncharacterized protein LOC109505220 n=1 Tax=Elaeis guineensis var. tenera TaxID=51953 RepID=A0A6J0PDQ9_ELAGV|nr:uncharacterized protein LOC109505220 [Elaeis guineensis]
MAGAWRSIDRGRGGGGSRRGRSGGRGRRLGTRFPLVLLGILGVPLSMLDPLVPLKKQGTPDVDIAEGVIPTSTNHQGTLKKTWSDLLKSDPPINIQKNSFHSGLNSGHRSSVFKRELVKKPMTSGTRRAEAFPKGCCFRCGGRGHYWRECRNGVVCFICRGIGHSSCTCGLGRKKMELNEVVFSPEKLESSQVFLPTEAQHVRRYNEWSRAGVMKVACSHSGVRPPGPVRMTQVLWRFHPSLDWGPHLHGI